LGKVETLLNNTSNHIDCLNAQIAQYENKLISMEVVMQYIKKLAPRVNVSHSRIHCKLTKDF